MRFIARFCKIAARDKSLDGNAFEFANTEPMAFTAGPGGHAPSGIPTYQPADLPENRERVGAASKKKKDPHIALFVAGGKMAGAGADIAHAVSEQLKYERSSDIRPELMGHQGESDRRFKKYLRAKYNKKEE